MTAGWIFISVCWNKIFFIVWPAGGCVSPWSERTGPTGPCRIESSSTGRLKSEKAKGKFIPGLQLIKHHDKKTYGGWRYSSTIFVLGIRWRWLVSFTPRPCYPQGKSFPVRIRLEVGWAPKPVLTLLWSIGKSLTLAGHRNLAFQPHSPSLYRQRSKMSNSH
jgi:hypothetical protein